MEVSDYSPTHRWFLFLAVVWWQPSRRQIRWARLPPNKAFSVDTAVSSWLIYSIYSIMFQFCHALKRRHSTFQTSPQGVELWRSLCNSSDFVTLRIPQVFGYSVSQCTMSVIACNSMWGLSPDGSAGSTSQYLTPPPPLPTRRLYVTPACVVHSRK